MSGLGTCRDCGEWIYWGEATRDDGTTRRIPYDEPSHETLHWATCQAQEYITFIGPNGRRTTERVTRCTKCRHAVYWETTRNGKKRPMDTYRDEDTLEYVPAYDCHFDTCVGARTYSSARDTPSSSQSKSTANGAATHHASTSSQPSTPYAVRIWLPDLNLTWPCSRQDITSAFRVMALKHHPDMGGRAEDFIKVKRAYDALNRLVPA